MNSFYNIPERSQKTIFIFKLDTNHEASSESSEACLQILPSSVNRQRD